MKRDTPTKDADGKDVPNIAKPADGKLEISASDDITFDDSKNAKVTKIHTQLIDDGVTDLTIKGYENNGTGNVTVVGTTDGTKQFTTLTLLKEDGSAIDSTTLSNAKTYFENSVKVVKEGGVQTGEATPADNKDDKTPEDNKDDKTPDDKAFEEKFGKQKTFGDHTFYVNENGKTSVVLKKSGIVWIREESGGTSAWYGFDNSEGALPEGSVVSVKWYGSSEPEFIEKLKEATKGMSSLGIIPEDDNKIWIFELNAYDESGNKINEFENGKFENGKKVKVYVELGNDWDMGDIGAIWSDEAEKRTTEIVSFLLSFFLVRDQGFEPWTP